MRSKLARYMINLEHFATVVEYGSISSASSVLSITQSALTRSIMRLEEVLNVQMLHRSTKGVKPTECGRALLEHIYNAEAELNKAMAVVQAICGAHDGRINCGAGAVSMNHILPTAVSKAKKNLGKVKINLVEGRTKDLLLKLKRCELDLVLGIEQNDEFFSEFISEPLIEENFNFCVRADHPLAKYTHVTLKDLLDQGCLVMPVLESTPLQRTFEEELARNECELGDGCVETLSHAVMRQLIYEDNYVAFCSSIWFANDISSGALKVLQGNWKMPSFSTMIFRRNTEVEPPWMTYFVNEIKRTASALGGDKLRKIGYPNQSAMHVI